MREPGTESKRMTSSYSALRPETHVQGELGMEALAGILSEFRHGNIVARSAEEKGMERHAGLLSARWNNRFPGFPIHEFPFTSFRGHLSTTDEFLAVARDSADSDICRAIIDLDRYLHLAEHGFRVEYQIGR